MSTLMTATPISMNIMHGYSIFSTGIVIQLHVVGMFLPSLFTGNLIKIYGHKNVCVILTLPGGSSSKLIEMLNKSSENLEPLIALSKLDECEIGPEEFSKLSELDSKIGIITGTNDLVGSIALSSENVLTQYLKENC